MKFIILIVFAALFADSTISFKNFDKFMGCTWNYPDRFEKFHGTTWEAKSGEYGFISFQKEPFDETAFKQRVDDDQSKNILADKIVDNGFELSIYNEHINGKENTDLPSRVIIKRTTGDGYFYLTGLELDEMQSFVSTCMPTIE